MGMAAAVLGAGVIGAGASIYGGTVQANAANNAANTSLTEANNSNALIQSQYQQNKATLSPYVNAGNSALTQLQGTAGNVSSGLTAAQLAQTPGYQFSLQQGLLATQAGSSAQGQGSAVAGIGSSQGAGIGASGPMGKALANYAENAAATTYQQQYTNYLAQNQQAYNQLAGLASIGGNAAAGTANAGTTAAGQSANSLLTGSSQYGSLSTAGAAGAAAGATGAANSLSNSALLYGVLGAGSGGSGLISQINTNPLQPLTGAAQNDLGLVGN